MTLLDRSMDIADGIMRVIYESGYYMDWVRFFYAYVAWPLWMILAILGGATHPIKNGTFGGLYFLQVKHLGDAPRAQPA